MADAPAKWTHNVGFTGAFGAQEALRVSSLDYTYMYGIGDQQRFRVGPGLRGMVYTGEFVNYAVAGSDAVTEVEANSSSDRLLVLSPSISSINLSLNLKYQGDKIAAGLNFDLLGLGFGGDKGGRFYQALPDTAAEGVIQESVNIAEGATSAPALNVIASGGSLQNELWVGYRLRPAITLRAGLTTFVSEFEINEDALPAGITETSYQHVTMLIFGGLRLQLN